MLLFEEGSPCLIDSERIEQESLKVLEVIGSPFYWNGLMVGTNEF